jgi:hypothetical protein
MSWETKTVEFPLREAFAGVALLGLLIGKNYPLYEIPEKAWMLADRMLKARPND